jgi:hypothetical protein
MPTINFSVTQSIDTLAVNLSASEALVMNINNPLVGASYFGLETIPDSNGVYTSSSPKNTLGSFTLGTGIIGLVKDDYKMSAVVSPGDNVLTFSPAVAVTGSTLRTRGISSPPVSGFDADALAFFDRVTNAGGTLTTTEKTAVNQLVIDLKANSLWTPMKAIYPMVGSSAAACAQNLKSSSFTGTFTSGWTFASTGVTPNGTSAYMDTFFSPSTNGMSISNGHLSSYSRSNLTGGDKSLIGVIGTITEIAINFASSAVYAMFGGNPYPAYTTSDKRGFYIVSRDTATTIKNYLSGVVKVNGAIVAFPDLPTGKILLGVQGTASGNRGNYSANEQAFASIGDTIDSTQASNFYTAVQAFQTTLSRQV